MGDDRLRTGEREREEREKEDLSGADGKRKLDGQSWATSLEMRANKIRGQKHKKNMQVRNT